MKKIAIISFLIICLLAMGLVAVAQTNVQEGSDPATASPSTGVLSSEKGLNLWKGILTNLADKLINRLESFKSEILSKLNKEYQNALTPIIDDTINYYKNAKTNVNNAKTLQELQILNQNSKTFFNKQMSRFYNELGNLMSNDAGVLIKNARDYSSKTDSIINQLSSLGIDTSEVKSLLNSYDNYIKAAEENTNKGINKIKNPQQPGDRINGFNLLKQAGGNLKSAKDLIPQIDSKLNSLAKKIPVVKPSGAYEKIKVIMETSPSGIYDPSVEYDDSGVGWLAYTASENDDIQLMGTHLAKSLDHGKIWTFIGKANSESRKTLVIDGVETEVTYRQETASLLFDPSDPDSNRRWKLFTARWFLKTGGKYSNTDWGSVQITYKYAASPDKLSSSKEIYLFGSSSCKQPTCSVKYNLNDFSPDLKDVTFYEEPGSLIKDEVLYLTLSAVSTKGQNTILLSSNDHGESWKYVGTLTNPDDAKSLGYDQFTASSMAEENGRTFLLVSPVKQILLPVHLEYNGVYVFEFDNISTAKLIKDGSKLKVIKYIPPISTKSVGGGQSEYHAQNTYGGIVMAQSDLTVSEERFKVYSTRQRIIEELTIPPPEPMPVPITPKSSGK